MLWTQNQRAESISKCERALALRTTVLKERALLVDDSANIAELHGELGAAYRAIGRPNLARSHLEAGIKLLAIVRAAWPDRQEYRAELEEQQAILASLQ